MDGDEEIKKQKNNFPLMKVIMYILFWALMISVFVKYNPNYEITSLKSIAYTPFDEISILVISSLPLKKYKYEILIVLIGSIAILYIYFLGVQEAMTTLLAFILGSTFPYLMEKLFD